MASLAPYLHQLNTQPRWQWRGRVVESSGQTIESEGPLCSIGDCCEILDSTGRRHAAEVIGFRANHLVSMPLEPPHGVRFGDAVFTAGGPARIAVSEAWLGRVMDACGRPLDGCPAPSARIMRGIDRRAPSPMSRLPIQNPLSTGVRVLDAMLTAGRGQRLGIFGGSGVGKSTLIGMMTRNTSADVTVLALVGERGREVREFLEDSLGEEGRARSVTVVSTSDESPLLRMRAALTAMTLAESFAEAGKNVLLVVDSLTRYAMAAREVGLAAGEPPTSKGYTPSVFSRLARLLERAGNFECGSITGFYTVLMEGDDQQDPLVDAARSILDGHIVLSRDLASQGWYPPVDVIDSLSRLMPAVVSAEHRQHALAIRRLMSLYAQSADMVRLGMYRAGADAEIDAALRCYPSLRTFFQQAPKDQANIHETLKTFLNLDLD